MRRARGPARRPDWRSARCAPSWSGSGGNPLGGGEVTGSDRVGEALGGGAERGSPRRERAGGTGVVAAGRRCRCRGRRRTARSGTARAGRGRSARAHQSAVVAQPATARAATRMMSWAAFDRLDHFFVVDNGMSWDVGRARWTDRITAASAGIRRSPVTSRRCPRVGWSGSARPLGRGATARNVIYVLCGGRLCDRSPAPARPIVSADSGAGGHRHVPYRM